MSVVGYKNPVDVAEELAKLFHDLAERQKLHILDIGAGTGEGGVKLVHAGFAHVDASDGSFGMLQEAKKRQVYKHVLPPEVLVKGLQMLGIKPKSYDVVTSSGSFFPFHLLGHHLRCFLDCAKTGGYIVISACPHNDQAIGLRPVIEELVREGVIMVVDEVYVPSWYRSDDGIVWGLKKLKRLHQSILRPFIRHIKSVNRFYGSTIRPVELECRSKISKEEFQIDSDFIIAIEASHE